MKKPWYLTSMRKSKPIGRGTRNLTANVPNALYNDIGICVSISGCKLGEYVRAVMQDAAEKRLIVRDNAEDKRRWHEAVMNGTRPLPPIRKEVAIDPPPIESQWQPRKTDRTPTKHQPVPAGLVHTSPPPGSSTPSLNEAPAQPTRTRAALRKMVVREAGQPPQQP